MGINNKTKSILKKAALTMGFLTLSLGVVAVTYNPDLTKGFDDPSHIGYKSYYNGDNVAIVNSTDSSLANEITMTAASTTAPTTGQVITISTANELNMFSTMCNTTPAYLGYNYKLATNIDYNDASSNAFIPVGWNGTAFSGTFDGQGYEISNLTFKNISTETDASTYSSMMYFAMFSENSGTITNLGLKDPSIAITRSISANMSATGGVAYLVGNNKSSGTVSNSFVIDEGSVLDEKSGIAASGGYRISSFVVDNAGTLSNNYVVVSSVLNYRVTDYLDYAEIAIKNTGTETNNYFYNGSITSYSANKITYNEDYGFEERTISNNYAGTYEEDTDSLVSALDSSWYKEEDYGYYGPFVGIDYAIRRGITFTVDATTNVAEATISSLNDFKYMYELFNSDDIMSSNNITYKITCDINLANTPVSCYTYNKGIGANILGVPFEHDLVTLSNGSYSTNPTIYNAAIMDSSRVVTSTGVDCYGMFNYLTGSVKNLNVISTAADITTAKSSNNAKAFGVIAGYVEAGTIENVNAYANFTNSTTDINEYYVGGITGILGGEGSIINSSAGGSINLSAAQAVTVKNTTTYMAGCAIGGVVGFVEDSLGTVSDCFNKASITSNLGASVPYAIGGVIGAGYTRTAEKLENAGAISAGATANTYSSLYVSGVFGRQLGMVNEDVQFTNNGAVTVNPNGNTTYVSGVINADIIKTASGALTASKFISGNGDTLFYASSMSNGGEITVNGSATNLEYTNVVNIKASNGVRSRLTGIYNLAYNYIYDGETSKKLTKLGTQEISLNNVNKFAGVVNVIGGTSTYSTMLSNSYNLRSMQFETTTTSDLSYSLNAVANGDYISFNNVSNEGDINVNIKNAVEGNINVNGVFNELSAGSTATAIYNSGNIDINYTANVTGNINASGICYANRNGITNINAYNPTSATYNSKLTGSLNNVVNKGNVKVSSTSFSGITYPTANYYWYRNTETTSVGNTNILGSVVATVFETVYSGPKVTGNINTSGVALVNESVITNTFNLGNIKALNYITETNEENRRQINAGGIATLNIGKYAYIINSANNGDITAANLASYDYTTETGQYGSDNSTTAPKKVIPDDTNYYYSDVTVGGIVSRNDKAETGDPYTNNTSNPNSSQVISFTINYGSIYAYNYAENSPYALTTTATKAAGIIGAGLCNVVNVNNYGSIYSGDTAAGIFGLVSLSSYKTEVAANKIYIANTINYGNVYSLKHAYDEYSLAISTFAKTTSDDNEHPKYDDFENDKIANFGFISNGVNTRFKYFTGSIIGIIDFDNDDNAATNIVVRYLVSFNEAISISGAEINVNSSVTANTTTIYSPYLKPDVDGFKDRDDYLATNVQYAPLSSGVIKDDFLKTNAVSGGHEIMTFYGVFNSNFTFRKVIEGGYSNGSVYFDTSKYTTDKFLTDFFQFIPYSYVNDNLMEKIGWKTSAYLDAANKFANSLEGTYLLYKNGITSTNYNTDLTSALSTSTWSAYADPEILVQLVKKLIASDDKAAILAYIEYIFSSENDNSAIFTSALRGTIVEYVYDTYPTLINESELINFSNGYSTILANALCSDSTNEVKQNVIDNINTYITNLDGVTKEELLLAYIDYLKDHGTTFFDATTSTSKYELLQNLFNTITDEDFYTTLLSLFSTDNQTIINSFSTALSGYGGFKKLENADKVAFFTNVINNNTEAEIKTYLNSFASEIGLFDYLRVDGYDKLSFEDVTNSISSTTNTNSDVIDERVKLWNQIKDTNTFKNWFTGLNIGTKYYLATEVNNTYQTDSAPIPYELSGDTAFAAFNSVDAPNVLGQTSDINFIYTTEVTPNTYFYGPYANSSGQNTYIPNGDGTTLSTTRQGTVRTNKTDLTLTSVGNTTNYYAVIFTEGNTDITSVATGNTGLVTATNPLLIRKRTNKPYYDNSSTRTGINIGLYYRTKKTDDYVIVNGIKQSLNNVELRRDASSNTNYDYVLGNTEIYCTTRNDKFTIYNADGTVKYSDQGNWNNLLNDYVYTATVSTVNSNWHSTGRTGLYVKFYSNSTQLQIQYAQNAMFTTRYIDYSDEQLLAIDGKLTKYAENSNYVSSDEENIINDIFNTILLTNTNRTAFLNVVAKALFESLGTTNTTNHINFIDNFVANGVTTSTTISSTAPFDYLDYSTTQTINEYLATLSTDSATKKKILNAAASNMNVFAELMEILFDKAKTEGAKTEWTPDGNGYGTSTDIKALYESLGGVDGSDIAKGYAYPFKIASTTLVQPASSTINMNLSSGTKAVDACSTYAATSSNIGYYVGSDIKVYKKDNQADFTNFYYPNGDGTPYTLPTAEHAAPTSDIISYLSDTKTDGTTSYRNGDYLIRMTGTSQLDINNESGMVVVPNATVGTWTGNLLVPNRCIWVAPTTPGTFKFVLSNIDTANMGFRLYKLTRSNPGHYDTYFTNLETSIECNKQLQAGKSYYYEINVSQEDIDAGYEYAIATGDGYKPYITYIDIGTNGTQDLTPSKTYYIQDQIDEVAEDFLKKTITYLTPLQGSYNNVSYPVNRYVQATSYDEGTTYYSRTSVDGIDGIYKYSVATGVNSTNYSNYYVTVDDKRISDYQALVFNDTFMKLLAKSSNAATCALIKSLDNKDAYAKMLEYLVRMDSRHFDSIINYAKNHNPSLLTDDYKYYLTGGYLATDYYKYYETDLTTTKLYTRINQLDDAYKYITGAHTIDSAKFEALCDHIGYELDMNYGIFALASNEGIQNGVFIPDNLTLASMNTYYSYDSTNEIYVIGDSTSAYWRTAGTTEYSSAASSGYTGDNAVTYTDSVNYAFYIEMKQLKKSIATTIFELDITDGTNTYYGDVDLENATVTFYSNSNSISGSFSISNLVIAANAISDKNVDTSLGTVSAYDTEFSTITITAEESTVTKTYSLLFKKLNTSFDIVYSDNTTSKTVAPSSTDTQVVINVTSSGDTKLPAGLDLKPYISLVGDNTYDMDSEYVTLSTQSQDHVVDTNGSATITMDISYTLPADTYAITLSICGASDSVTYIKQVNTAYAITKFGFDGADRVSSFSDNTLTSTIPFGRAYDDTELTGYDTDSFYLYDFEISPNAKVVINAAKEIGTNGLMTYTVTYIVTSESDVDATYTHIMTENTPFANNSTYASIYADGNNVSATLPDDKTYADLTEAQRPYYLSAGTLTYVAAEDTYIPASAIWSLEDDMKAEVSFNRGIQPQYRIKYNLSNFYTLGNDVTYSASAATLTNGAAVQVTYAGLTVTVSENNDTGLYTFVYVYSNTGTWNGESYTRSYTFPEFIINKLASTDALLKQLTFLEQSIVLGNTATVMYPEQVLVPDNSATNSTYETTDITYDSAFNSTDRNIVVSTSGINYKNNSDSTDYNDYYAIGTVADAYLGYYCPGFKIEEHAQIYQYTTLAKLTQYGADRNQTVTDASILGNHESTMFLYVPFTVGTSVEIYLVELDSNGYWTNVYSTDYDGTNANGVGIKKWTYTANTVKTNDAKDYVPTEANAKPVATSAGNATNNTSLYMDYVGTPIDGHFWYVSYVIFSEEKLQGGTSAGNIRYYHISVIDATNTIQFNVNIYVTNTLSTSDLADIYLTIAENIYDGTTKTSERQISAHAIPYVVESTQQTADGTTETASGCTLSGTYNVYTLKYTLQTLPKGYFYFYVDLPNGYVAKAYTDMDNQISTSTEPGASEDGAFLPKTSIITVKVALDLVIDAGTADDSSVWAVKTSDIYTVQASYTAQASN